MRAARDMSAVLALVQRVGPFLPQSFDVQDNAVSDLSQYQIWVCGRRSGKTTGLMQLVLRVAALTERKHQTDDILVSYVAPTKNQARRLVWEKMKAYTNSHGIEASYNDTECICRINAGQVWLMGADNDRDVDRLRGFAYRLVVVDEAQSVTADLNNLVNDVISPALADYRGRLVLAGTPSASCMGYFHDVSTARDERWARHHWTVMDNPLFPAWRGRPDWRDEATAYLNEIREARGWEHDDPTYLREWMGQWAQDSRALVYAYDPTRNVYDALPGGHAWQHIIGVDFGMDDAFAVVVWAFAEDHLNLYQVDEYAVTGKTVSDWAAVIGEKVKRWSPMAVVADSGGLGKAIISELCSRFSLPITAAEKKNKAAYIELLNSDLRNGKVLIQRGSRLGRTWLALQWDDAHKVEDPRTPNDVADAALYSYREALHWLSREKAAPINNDRDWSSVLEEKLLKQRLAKQRAVNKRGY